MSAAGERGGASLGSGRPNRCSAGCGVPPGRGSGRFLAQVWGRTASPTTQRRAFRRRSNNYRPDQSLPRRAVRRAQSNVSLQSWVREWIEGRRLASFPHHPACSSSIFRTSRAMLLLGEVGPTCVYPLLHPLVRWDERRSELNPDLCYEAQVADRLEVVMHGMQSEQLFFCMSVEC